MVIDAMSFRVLVTFGLCVQLFLADRSHAIEQDRQTVARRALQSVALIVTTDSNNNLLAQGSGFVISGNRFVTNYHVIQSAERIFVRLPSQSEISEVKSFVAISRELDIAVLFLETTAPINLVVSKEDFPQVADTVYAIGSPKGVEGTFSEGIVSGVRRDQAASLIQFTAPVSPGSSGGPLLNGAGEVIGIVTGQIQEGQNLNFATSVKHLRALLAQAGEPKSISLLEHNPSSVRAESPSAEQLYVLGKQYLSGESGFEKSTERAFDLLLKSAEMGHSFARSELGALYWYGKDGIPQDFSKAVYWLSLAAEDGIWVSEALLGDAYKNGRGVPKDEREAFSWYLKAAESGMPYLQTQIGLSFQLGVGVEQDYDKAREWLTKAADQGDSPAQHALALIFLRGDGVRKDIVRAYMWMNIMAASGNEAAAQTRDSLIPEMTQAQVTEAQELSSNWFENRRKEDAEH